MLCCILFLTDANAQNCGNCKSKPTVAQYDLDVQVAEPKLNGTDSTGWMEWLQLFWLGRHANNYLFENNKNCIRFVVGPDQDANKNGVQEVFKLGAAYTHLPHSSYNEGYLTTGYVKKTGEGYMIHIELQSACKRKTIAFADVPFPLSSVLENSITIGQQAALKLMSLSDKIREFELKERSESKDFLLRTSTGDAIKIVPAKKNLTTGQQTEFTITLLDCDKTPLSGREIEFNEAMLNGTKIKGTIGGSVYPAKVITDAAGLAKATFKMTASPGQPAIINAHSLTRTSIQCADAVTGSEKIDAIPAYKVVVDYFKTGAEEFNMRSNEDRVSLFANEQKNWTVAYSTTLYHYSATTKKDGEQIIITPEFEQQIPNGGKTVVSDHRGYSEFVINEKPLELTASPVGRMPGTEINTQQAFSSSPLPPSVSFIIQNNELIFFSCSIEFPEKEDSLSPLAGTFGITKDDRDPRNNEPWLPVKGKKITDPNSPYKWEYVLDYINKETNDRSGTVFKMGKKETEHAQVRILTY